MKQKSKKNKKHRRENENPNRPKGRGIYLVGIFNVVNTLKHFFNPITASGGVFTTNKKILKINTTKSEQNNKLNLTKIQKKEPKTNTKMAKLTYKQMPIGGMIEKAGSSLDFKTGDWKVFKPCWDEKKCTHCMFCVVYCPDNCIPVEKMKVDKIKNETNPSQNEINNTKRKETDFDYCKGCGICAKVCPVKCIKMKEDK